jgi:hypothetical protein
MGDPLRPNVKSHIQFMFQNTKKSCFWPEECLIILQMIYISEIFSQHFKTSHFEEIWQHALNSCSTFNSLVWD